MKICKTYDSFVDIFSKPCSRNGDENVSSCTRVLHTEKKTVSLSLGGGVAYEWILLGKYNKICDDTGSAPCFQLDHSIKDPVPYSEG